MTSILLHCSPKGIMTKNNRMWGGAFNDKMHPHLEKINQSIDIDKRLVWYDIEVSTVHVKMLHKKLIISDDIYNDILQGLEKVEQDIKKGLFTTSYELEDIHTHIENMLKKHIGESADFLHIARSRNDQVATVTAMWMRDAILVLIKEISLLQKTIITKAQKEKEQIVPGFTHFQPAQAISYGHYMLALCSMIDRDKRRLHDVYDRVIDQCPLGSCALSGTSFPIDRNYTAQVLGFRQPSHNAMDSVSSRDVAMEFLNHMSICGITLSRIMKEMIVFSSICLGWITFSDQWTTGSSIMPQKKNPDAAEIVRSYSGILVGNAQSFTTIMKGIPFAYCKDMQEDKRFLFSSFDCILSMIQVTNNLLENMTVISEKSHTCLHKGYATATDLADWLVKNTTVSFREAHRIAGMIVKEACNRNISLHDMPLKDFQSFHSKIDNSIYSCLSINNSVNSKTSIGGTSIKEVERNIAKWNILLQEHIPYNQELINKVNGVFLHETTSIKNS